MICATLTPAGRGIIDLLIHAGEDWIITDFKTDRADSEEHARDLIRQNNYDEQLARYVQALKDQRGITPHARLIFLNVKNQLAVFDHLTRIKQKS
jgi:hypothetical protein